MEYNFKGKIGAEIECIVKKKDAQKLKDLCDNLNYVLSSDGSIRDYNYAKEEAREIKIKPYDIKDIKKMSEDIKKVFKLIKVNKSCGLHIHLSFEKLSNYYKLCCWKFVEQFQNSYNNKFSLAIEQERKQNHFSKFYDTEISYNMDVNDQVAKPKSYGKPSSRYHCINFNAFVLYKTVEFRIFCATSKIKKFKDNVNFLLKNVDDFLKQENFKSFEVAKPQIKMQKQQDKVVIKEIITKEEIKILQELNKSKVQEEKENVQH